MKPNVFFWTLIGTLIVIQAQAQNTIQINATNSDSNANLDLRAIASQFGKSQNLEDFEMRLNDPNLQLSNLDLNNDNEVDYLRVVESIENRTHLILIQAIINRDIYQDVATINVTKDNYNAITVQIIGNRVVYGNHCIYQPTFYTTPTLLSVFWNSNYRPYYSNWRWNYYPKHYYSWHPYPTHSYRKNINYYLNHNRFYGNINSNRYYPITKTYGNQYPNYNYSNLERYESNRRELNENRAYRRDDEYNNERRNYNTFSNKMDNEPQRNKYTRENTQNRPLEIKEVEINRNNTQYVSTPSIQENNRNSRGNFRRN